ncbi:hypothetical protein AAFF_G00212990 [Aldrovandia affinis]|uniref:Uncharacterized protein n=1 Tax=Aldrovandia affinis TaxID=143900 RepID=A0AAD7RGY7_9TELE|nr:hypothetical protein AAFF_G00212990 [Aldrovandia affinis]
MDSGSRRDGCAHGQRIGTAHTEVSTPTERLTRRSADANAPERPAGHDSSLITQTRCSAWPLTMAERTLTRGASSDRRRGERGTSSDIEGLSDGSWAERGCLCSERAVKGRLRGATAAPLTFSDR